MTSSFANRVVLILGAAVEPGPAIARKLAAEGAGIALIDADSKGLQSLAAELEKCGARVWSGKLGDDPETSLPKDIAQIKKQFGRLDILINNTPKPAPVTLGELTPAAFGETLRSVLSAPYASLWAAVPAMREGGFGRVLNIGGIEYLGLPGRVGAASAQAGFFGMIRAAALEVARDNITVNNLVLGDIAADAALSDEAKAAMAGAIPVKRVGSLDDVLHAAMFFIDEKTKYVTGQTFFVCGGKSVHFSMSI